MIFKRLMEKHIPLIKMIQRLACNNVALAAINVNKLPIVVYFTGKVKGGFKLKIVN